MTRRARFKTYHMIQSGSSVRINKQDHTTGEILQEVRVPKSILQRLIKEYFTEQN